MEQPKLKVAVVGAGISGLVTLKECLAAGLDAVAFESRAEIGGNWAYESRVNEPVDVAVYAGTMLNSCRDTSSFTDFPLDPSRYGDYFNQRQFQQYLYEYAEHFSLTKHIQFKTRVLDCAPQGDGTWKVKIQHRDSEDTEKPEELLFGAVLVASGHNTSPHIPDFKGKDAFQGDFLHSYFYKTPGPFEGKRVAVIGLGSTGVDIACEIAPQAKELHIITRRGGWILPRYVLGKPTEAWDNRATQLWAPISAAQWIQTKLLTIVDGELPKELKPDHKLMEQNPTIRGDFLEQVRTGLITVQRADVSSLTETGITLSNGKTLDVDVIISATGYNNFDIPYLPSDVVRSSSTPANSVDLYKFIHPPKYPGLFFLGFRENFGPLPPLVEAQARYTAGVLAGRMLIPSEDKMFAEIKKLHAWQAKMFLHTDRHALTGLNVPYVDEMLEPLGAVPSFGKLLGRVFTSNPFTALKVLNAVWFGIPASAQWRLCGHGAKEELAKATLLRIGGKNEGLSEREVEELKKV